MKKLTSNLIKITCALFSVFFFQSIFAQQNDGTIKLEVQIQNDDYFNNRKQFETKLIKHMSSPQQPVASDSADVPPMGVSECFFKSGNLALKAWINKPDDN